jgi:hypothetical protein
VEISSDLSCIEVEPIYFLYTNLYFDLGPGRALVGSLKTRFVHGLHVSENVLLTKSIFAKMSSAAVGSSFMVEPIVQFQNEAVHLKYNVCCTRNGVDQPRWSEDLTVEIVH